MDPTDLMWSLTPWPRAWDITSRE